MFNDQIHLNALNYIVLPLAFFLNYYQLCIRFRKDDEYYTELKK